MPQSAPHTTLGLDLSTQSLSAVLLDAASGQTLWSHSLVYRDDPRLLGYGFEHDTMLVPPREPGEAEQPPRLFLAAIDAMFDDLKSAGPGCASIAAINTSGQQHGHVYLNASAGPAFAQLNAGGRSEPLATRLAGVFAYGNAPIWKTANTADEAALIRARVGGQAAIVALSGSDMPLRFSVAAHRHIALRQPLAYRTTRRIVQLSSLVPAILCGNDGIPLDYGNACGTGLMNYRKRAWDDTLLAAAADDLPGGMAALAAMLPPIVHPLASVGTVARYFQERHGLPADCRIIAGSGDNPQSKVLADGDMLSLGSSFVYMISTPDGGVDPSGAANAMYDGLGRPFNFVCRSNGALTWDRLRAMYGLAKKDFMSAEAALADLRHGDRLRFWHPDVESFPLIAANAQIVRRDAQAADFAGDYAGVVDSALGLVYRYGRKIGNTGTDAAPISVCGGPSASAEIMRRVAAIWNRPAKQTGDAGAALGAACAAAVALLPASEPERRADVARAVRDGLSAGGQTFQPDAETVRYYHAPDGYLDRLETAFEQLRG